MSHALGHAQLHTYLPSIPLLSMLQNLYIDAFLGSKSPLNQKCKGAERQHGLLSAFELQMGPNDCKWAPLRRLDCALSGGQPCVQEPAARVPKIRSVFARNRSPVQYRPCTRGTDLLDRQAVKVPVVNVKCFKRRKINQNFC